MVRDHEERTLHWNALPPLDSEAAGRVIHNPRRAVTHAGLAERTIVRDEAVSDAVRDGPYEPAKDLHAQARRTADEGLGALSRDDPGDLSLLTKVGRRQRVRVCNAFEHGPRIRRGSRPVQRSWRSS